MTEKTEKPSAADALKRALAAKQATSRNTGAFGGGGRAATDQETTPGPAAHSKLAKGIDITEDVKLESAADAFGHGVDNKKDD